MEKAINIMKMNRQKSKYYVKSPAEVKEIIKASRSTGSMFFMQNNLDRNLYGSLHQLLLYCSAPLKNC